MLWYAMRSKPNKEIVLWQELCARNVECFYPQLRVHPVNPRSRKSRPYFPGYLFLRADIECVGISMFQWLPFSLGLVSFDDKPAPIPDNLVHTIRRHIDEINTAGRAQFEGLERGNDVLIQGGAFDGYQAIFDAYLPGNERVRVFLKLLQVQQMKLELPATRIQRHELH